MFSNKMDWSVEEYEEATKLDGSYKKRKKRQGSFFRKLIVQLNRPFYREWLLARQLVSQCQVRP